MFWYTMCNQHEINDLHGAYFFYKMLRVDSDGSNIIRETSNELNGVNQYWTMSVFIRSTLASIVTICTCKSCGNTHEYWPNTSKMCLHASAIFVSFEAIVIHCKACGWSLPGN